MVDQCAREAAIWDAGYAAGYRHAVEGRPSVLPDAVRAPVIDLHAWRAEREAMVSVSMRAH